MTTFLSGRDLLANLPREAGFQVLDPAFRAVQKTVMPVIGWDGRSLLPFGTCFAISEDGIALTAWHVIQEFVEEYGAATFEGDAGLYVVFETDEPVTGTSNSVIGGPLPVISYANTGENDVCALRVAIESREKSIFSPVSIQVGVPEVDSGCVALGYPIMTLEGEVLRQETRADSLTEIDYARQIAVSEGQVKEIHPVQRDSVLLNFPCFRTTVRCDSGMSGGPVINDKGEICGMVCRGWDFAGEATEPMSYGSLLAPVLQLGVARGQGSTKLADLDISEAISVKGHEDLAISKDAHGGWLWYGDSPDRK